MFRTNSISSEYASAARRVLFEMQREACAEQIARARTDPNFRCEWCFTDQSGQPLVQYRHHREWQSLAAEHDRLVMWFPVGHGKTTQAKMTLCALLGEHPDRQYAYVSSKAKQAQKTIGAVKREIESNERLRMVYPNLRPQISHLTRAREEWGNTAIRIAGCPPGTRDPSLSAFGMDGQILGTRLHGAILDNILDDANTMNSDQRKKILNRIKNEIMNRIDKHGFLWVIDTAWYVDDALHELANLPGWHSIKFDAEQGFDQDETLWPVLFDRQRLDFKLGEMGQTAYDRSYRNKPWSESMRHFKDEFWDSCYGRCQWLDEWDTVNLDSQITLRTGVDLAIRTGEQHDLTSFATVAYSGHRRKLVNIEAQRIEGPAILSKIVSVYRRFHAPVNNAGGDAMFIVEDNAAQNYIVQMVRDAAIMKAKGLTLAEAGDIRIVGRTTTATKRDSQLGIPAIAAGIEMGRWDFPVHNQVKQLREEMKVWTPDAKHYGDRLMSLWIATADAQAISAELTVDFID